MNETPASPTACSSSRLEGVDRDQRFVLHNVTWHQYERLRELLDDVPGLRMTYLKGTLELTSPSREHELYKKTIARLLEIYALERGIELNGYGSMTFRREAKARGLEPDECYCLGELKEVPDLAVEVETSCGGMDKLPVYAGLGVAELWLWRDDGLHVFHLEEGEYREADRSVVLPEMEISLLARFIRDQNQTRAVRAFRDELRARG